MAQVQDVFAVADSDVPVVMSRCILPSDARCKKVSGRWMVLSLEAPLEFCNGPIFKTKRAAIEWADLNASAVWSRMKERLMARQSSE